MKLISIDTPEEEEDDLCRDMTDEEGIKWAASLHSCFQNAFDYLSDRTFEEVSKQIGIPASILDHVYNDQEYDVLHSVFLKIEQWCKEQEQIFEPHASNVCLHPGQPIMMQNSGDCEDGSYIFNFRCSECGYLKTEWYPPEMVERAAMLRQKQYMFFK
jgi:hypothetical protein